MYSVMAFDEQKFHFAGFHGTSVANAKRIEEAGFTDTNGDVFFAPMDNMGFAMTHGRRRATEYGDAQYAVVTATFPARGLEFGLGGDQIRVPREQIGSIAVQAVAYFDVLPPQR